MSDLISREEAINAFRKELCKTDEHDMVYAIGFGGIERIINKLPSIDAVPIVRCKDCRWGREACGNIECWVDINIPPEYHGYEWFCPNGERKEE